jgi:hypothetical protein
MLDEQMGRARATGSMGGERQADVAATDALTGLIVVVVPGLPAAV